MPSPGSPGFPEEIRGWMYAIHGRDLVRYESLEEARHDPDGAVVLSGESGVAVFLTAPARLVRCEAQLLVTPGPPIEHLPWDFDIRPPAVPFPD